MNKIFTYFKNGWADFLNWLGKREAVVVSNAKTLIDELAPVFEKDLLADGSTILDDAVVAIKGGENPIAAVVAGATSLLPALVSQGIQLSQEAALTLSSIISAKINAAKASLSSQSGTATVGTQAGVTAAGGTSS